MNTSDYKLGYQIEREYSNTPCLTKGDRFSESIKRNNNHEVKKESTT